MEVFEGEIRRLSRRNEMITDRLAESSLTEVETARLENELVVNQQGLNTLYTGLSAAVAVAASKPPSLSEAQTADSPKRSPKVAEENGRREPSDEVRQQLEAMQKENAALKARLDEGEKTKPEGSENGLEKNPNFFNNSEESAVPSEGQSKNQSRPSLSNGSTREHRDVTSRVYSHNGSYTKRAGAARRELLAVEERNTRRAIQRNATQRWNAMLRNESSSRPIDRSHPGRIPTSRGASPAKMASTSPLRAYPSQSPVRSSSMTDSVQGLSASSAPPRDTSPVVVAQAPEVSRLNLTSVLKGPSVAGSQRSTPRTPRTPAEARAESPRVVLQHLRRAENKAEKLLGVRLGRDGQI